MPVTLSYRQDTTMDKGILYVVLLYTQGVHCIEFTVYCVFKVFAHFVFRRKRAFYKTNDTQTACLPWAEGRATRSGKAF